MSHSELSAALVAIPEALREPLIAQFVEALEEYRCSDWEKVGAKAGKFCEIAYCICEGYATDNFPAAPAKPRNMFQACQKLEVLNKTKGRSVCIQIPRVLIGLYELRNNRAIGHVSGELDPNHMDAEFFLRGMKWITAEFVRAFSNLPVDDSRAIVEAVTTRTLHLVWVQDGLKRVLKPSLDAREQILLLAYHETSAVTVPQLQAWIGYTNGSRLRKTVLKKLHDEALVHFDPSEDRVQLLPPGRLRAEALLSAS